LLLHLQFVVIGPNCHGFTANKKVPWKV
jgi:hypothetical protein